MKLAITNVYTPGNLTEKLTGFALDSPKLGVIEGQLIHFGGWVIGLENPVELLECVFNEKVVCHFSVDRHRPDVAKIFSDNKQAISCGFSRSLIVDGLSDILNYICELY
ncbi:MAG: hypothetical protein HC799_18615 [Limnothrix sp. RL_2_0]|nr:hypothetical protein [Limnothrix sp. RL_2_0]